MLLRRAQASQRAPQADNAHKDPSLTTYTPLVLMWISCEPESEKVMQGGA